MTRNRRNSYTKLAERIVTDNAFDRIRAYARVELSEEMHQTHDHKFLPGDRVRDIKSGKEGVVIVVSKDGKIVQTDFGPVNRFDLKWLEADDAEDCS